MIKISPYGRGSDYAWVYECLLHDLRGHWLVILCGNFPCDQVGVWSFAVLSDAYDMGSSSGMGARFWYRAGWRNYARVHNKFLTIFHRAFLQMLPYGFYFLFGNMPKFWQQRSNCMSQRLVAKVGVMA